MELQYLATTMPLTSLPNRFLLMDRLQQTLARANRYKQPFAVLFVDLDDFKTINDTFGHDFGDLLLRFIAQRLSTSVRESDTVARLGGDEFVILAEAFQHEHMYWLPPIRSRQESLRPFRSTTNLVQ